MYRQDFWAEVFKVSGSVTPFVMSRVLVFSAFAAVVYAATEYTGIKTGLAVAPYEIIGVVLALLLVLRTNAGYDRWYEARKLWGGIVNQCRNLAVIGRVYGPKDAEWQTEFATWTASFPHACRHSLRQETDLKDLEPLLGKRGADQLAASDHQPMYVVGRLAKLLQEALSTGQMDRFAFMQAEHERAMLLDHLGACERIMKTPLAQVFSIKIRRFLFVYLIALPLAIVDKTGVTTPLIVLLVSYPLLSLDQIGIELQNPFSLQRLSHLPLNDISEAIERNVLAYAHSENALANVALPGNRQALANKNLQKHKSPEAIPVRTTA